ncbi:tuberin, putative [Entamoeba invadens IP1]|uniref:tuberin, putative n=1 Tax=Entamoeba invadens IP1 TaxID=370355 RepID=UPI0002C3EACD|nr:tuberin, putative [Entamoeba invadens IP1]ELP93201.1 tuberin, putative [Entamoeba invadens IP1]|eukprot:XP_004259972.1 tuberin, putative [Entamoeba invadens IP1]
MASELDKKIRKKQTSLFDPKESAPNKLKACISLLEKQSVEEFQIFVRPEKQKFSMFIIEVSQYVENHTKKGKITVPVKEALTHIKVLNAMIGLYEYPELTVFDLYQKYLNNYLKIETAPEVREAAFQLVIDLVLKYGEQSALTDYFLGTINLGCLFNLPGYPVQKLDYAEVCFSLPESDFDQSSMSIKLVSDFIKQLKKPENFEKLFHLVEALLSYIFPLFAEASKYKYKLAHPLINLKQTTPVQVQKYVLDFLKELLVSPISLKLKNRPNTIPFIHCLYSSILTLTPDEATKPVISQTIPYFFSEFIFNQFRTSELEEIVKTKHFLVTELIPFFDKPFVIGKPLIVGQIAEEIKATLYKMTTFGCDNEMKDIVIQTVLTCIDLLLKAQLGQSAGSFTELIFMFYVKWDVSDKYWELLRTRIAENMSNEFVTKQLSKKLWHYTRAVFREKYSPLLLENTDEVLVGNKKVLRSTRTEIPDEVFVAPAADEKFTLLFGECDQQSSIKWWMRFYSLLEHVNDLKSSESYENGIRILYEVCCLFIRAETKMCEQFNLEAKEGRPELIEIFGKIFFDAFAKSEHTPKSLEYSYRVICKLVNRGYVRYSNELYSRFYEIISNGLPLMPVVILEELFDIVPNQIPGWPVLVIPVIGQLQNLTQDNFKGIANLNRDAQIISFLMSLITVEDIYPKILEDVGGISGTLKTTYDDSLTKCFKNLLQVFTSTKSQSTMLFGLIDHIVFARRKNPEADINETLDMILKRIEIPIEDVYRPASEALGQLALFNQYLTEEDVQYIIVKMMSSITNPQTRSESIACAFTALTEWAFAPSCVFIKALIPEVTAQLLNGISYAMSLTPTPHPTDQTIKYRACANECAEIFLQTLLNIFGFVPSEKGSDKFLSTHVEDGEVTWWLYGNNILSIEKGDDTHFCFLVIRNAVGKTRWGIQSVSTLEELGMTSPQKREKITLHDIIKDQPKQLVEERRVEVVQNKLREMIDSAVSKESDLLDWGLPKGVDKDSYQNDITCTKDEIEKTNSKIQEFGQHIVLLKNEEKSLVSVTPPQIDTTKLLVHGLLCQLHFIDPIPKNQPVLVPINPHEKFKILLGNLDKTCSRPFHKIGLIYVMNNQTDQYDILKNTSGSAAYNEFVEGLGWTLDIRTHSGFLGGLDKTYMSTGEYIRYFADATKEVIFHDITLIPTQEDDSQQLTKKRHVGNDYVHIVWNESGEYSPYTITSQFNAAHIVISPLGNGLHKIRIWRKQNVRQFGPLLDGMVVGKDLLPALVRETAVNANYCCSLNISPDDYLKPYLRRSTLIKEIIDKNDSFNTPSFFSTLSMISNPTCVNDLTTKK